MRYRYQSNRRIRSRRVKHRRIKDYVKARLLDSCAFCRGKVELYGRMVE